MFGDLGSGEGERRLRGSEGRRVGGEGEGSGGGA